MKLLNGVEFAKEAGGVHKSSISRARDSGELIPDANGLYDPSHPMNAAYILKQLEKQKGKLEKTTKKKPAKKTTSKKTEKPKTKTVTKKAPPRAAARGTSNLTKIEAEIMLKEVQIKQAEVNYAVSVGDVIPREEIQHVWNKLFNARSDFADFGQRYAVEWAAALGVSDPKKISMLRAQIDRAVERCFNNFCDQIEGEL